MAKPTVENIALEAGEKTDSQKADKARRSFRNSLKNVERDIASGNLTQEQLQNANRIKESLETNIQQSYATKAGEYLVEPDRMLKSAETAKELIKNNYDNTKNNRKNQLFQRDINQASVGGVSTKSKEEVKIFYAMTQEFWEGHDISVRNKLIMSSLGVNTLEEAWDIVMNNKDAKTALEKATNQSVEDGSNDVPDEIGSPEYIKWLVVTRDTSRKKLKKNE